MLSWNRRFSTAKKGAQGTVIKGQPSPIGERAWPLLFAWIVLNGICSILTPGCIYAVPLVERHEENSPPHVERESLDPSPDDDLTVVIRPPETREFSIPFVEDSDVGDNLYSRWFLRTDIPPVRKVADLPAQASGSVVRQVGWRFELDPCSAQTRFILARPSAVLEVMISDRQFVFGPDEKEVPADARHIFVNWHLEIAEGTCDDSVDFE